jgi:probable HAF family extracellular repeat protein
MNSRLLRNLLLGLIGLVGAVVLAITLSWFTATTAATTFYYAVTEINPLVGYPYLSTPWRINDVGQVIGRGYRESSPRSEHHAFLWQNGTTIDLGTLGGDRSYAWGINNLGQVVGASVTSSGFRHPYLWQNGVMTDLGTYGSDNSSMAIGINNNGQVVGWSYQTAYPPYGHPTAFTNHAVLWQNGGITDLGVLSGDNASSAYTINDLGQVFGSSFKYDTSNSIQSLFRWQNGAMTNLGNIDSNAFINSINNQGLAVGELYEGYNGSAFLWQNGTTTNLDSLGGTFASAYDVNEAGTVVGYSDTNNGSGSAVMWRNGQIFNLNNLLQPNSGWQLISANGINNNGQIVGIGDFNGQRKGFLLTPVTVTN